jgi:hypothetical protein
MIVCRLHHAQCKSPVIAVGNSQEKSVGHFALWKQNDCVDGQGSTPTLVPINESKICGVEWSREGLLSRSALLLAFLERQKKFSRDIYH